MQSFFRQLGLTKNEQDIYLLLLQYGALIASIIARRLSLKRVTAYASLRSLQKKNLLNTFIKNDVTYFEAVSPEELISLCRERVNQQKALEEEAKELLPALKIIQEKQLTPIFEIKGELKYYQGIDAVAKLVDETLEESEKEQLCFGLNTYHTAHQDDIWRDYTDRRVNQGMHVRSIQPDTAEAKAYKARDQKELRTTRLVPASQFPGECELNIIGDMIALFATQGDFPVGMKIYHPDMARALRSLFELAWREAGDIE